MNRPINEDKTCWNCPYAELKGNVDFRSCGQSKEEIRKKKDNMVITCSRQENLGYFEPTIKFKQCPIWELDEEYNMYKPKNAKVMILGIDGYLGWALALKLGKLGFQVSGVDNFKRRAMVLEGGAKSITPILDMEERLKIAKEKMGIDINFREIDIEKENDKLEKFMEEVKPDSIVHYGEIPSAPYSMIDSDHAVDVQVNNVIGTLKVLYNMRDIVPESSLIKLGTLGEYGNNLTGRPLFEGFFPSDAVLKWDEREWSMGGELTPRNPPSFYHCCYDDQTEVFTYKGWKYFKNLTYSDKILNWDIENNITSFENPDKIMNYDYKGKMYKLTQRKVDLLVTPNHKMVVGNKCRTKKLNWKLLEAKDIKSICKFYKVCIPNWVGKKKEFFILPSVKTASTKKKGIYYYRNVNKRKFLMNDWLEFFAWFITEGCIYKNKKSLGNYKISIAQDEKNEENLDEIEKIIKKLGYNYNFNRHRGKIKSISIENSQLGQYLIKFGKSYQKYIPTEIKNLPKEQLEILLNTLIKGDGTVVVRGTNMYKVYYTSSKQLADDVQEIAVKLGYSAILTKGEKRKGMNYYPYSISISHTIDTQINQLHDNDSWIDYNGIVSCCTIKNNTLYVRRNGRPVWCGNSKVHDSLNIYESCKYFWLRSMDCMQGVIYGINTKEIRDNLELCTRYDISEILGTVINRFIAQAIIGIPLTIYGEGNQLRGFIGLEDAMQCMVRLICSPPEPGQYDVLNQVTGIYKIGDLAENVAEIGNELGLNVTIQRLENPRVEADRHPIEVVSKKLEREFGLKAKVKLKDEIRKIFKVLMQPEIKQRIIDVKDTIMPYTKWDGQHGESGVLEVYQPGTKESTINLKQQLDTVDGKKRELTSISDDDE